MKSIQQIARELGVSRQAVYERVRSKGVKLEELTREKQGKTTVYSDDAVKTIVSCFSQEEDNCKEKPVKCKEPDSKTDSKIDTTKAKKQKNQEQARELEELKKALQEAQRQIEEAQRREQEARQEVERLHQIEEEQRHTISSLSETIRINASREAVKIGAPQAERIGIIERVKRLFGR